MVLILRLSYSQVDLRTDFYCSYLFLALLVPILVYHVFFIIFPRMAGNEYRNDRDSSSRYRFFHSHVFRSEALCKFTTVYLTYLEDGVYSQIAHAVC